MCSQKYSTCHQFFINSLTLFFIIIGLLPLRVKITRGQLICQTSRASSTYTLLLIFITLALNTLSIPKLNGLEYLAKGPLGTKLKLAKAIFGTITLLLTWLIMLSKRKTLDNILNKFIDINNEMHEPGGIYKVKNVNIRLISIFIINSIIWTGVLSTDTYSYDNFTPIIWISTMTPSFIVNWLLIQLTIMLCLLEIRFKSVNKAIFKLCPIAGRSSGTYDEIGDYRDQFSSAILPTILNIKRTHTKLYEITNDVANYYSVSLLFGITFFCGTIIYTSYYLVIPIMVSPWSADVFMNIIHTILTLAMQFFPIIVMAVCVDRLSHQMHKTADAVHKLLAEMSSCREVRAELKRFSLELFHRNVEFSAHGVFPLNSSLLHSIVSAAVTYLIILMQFQRGQS